MPAFQARGSCNLVVIRVDTYTVSFVPEAYDQPPDPWFRRLRHKIAFERAQRKWFAKRDKAIEESLSRSVSQLASQYRVISAPRAHVHVVVVPQEGRDFGTFRPGTRNFYFEAWRSLAGLKGEGVVSVFEVKQGEQPSLWHERLVRYAREVDATHVIAHIESDPGSEGASWTWDLAWAHLERNWDGVLLGVMFDSAFEWISAKARMLARISPRFMVVDICMPMTGSIVRGRREVGPVNMPISQESLALVEEVRKGASKVWDVSFAGVMYPYREKLVDDLREMGVSLTVNPHRRDRAAKDAESRVNQPSWLSYMGGLASSHMTLNFSQSSAGNFEQLKTRVLESTLVGSLLLTDDIDRTKRFWKPNEEYIPFRSVEDLPAIISSLLIDKPRLRQISEAGRLRALDIAPIGFWSEIEEGLKRRRLPTILEED